MKTKSFICWLLSLGALSCAFSTVMVFKTYGMFYELPPMLLSILAVIMVYLCVMVALWADRWPHRWRRYIGLYVVLGLVGMYVPALPHVAQIKAAFVGFMPLVLMCAMWLVKRYWTISL